MNLIPLKVGMFIVGVALSAVNGITVGKGPLDVIGGLLCIGALFLPRKIE